MADKTTTPVIRVFDDYRGRPSKERVISKGVYIVGDKRLMGQENYLIENGHAESIDVTFEEYQDMLKEALKYQLEQPLPDGFRGLPPAQGQKEFGQLTPREFAHMLIDPEKVTLPLPPDGLRSLTVDPKTGLQVEAGSEDDPTEYAVIDENAPQIGTPRPEDTGIPNPRSVATDGGVMSASGVHPPVTGERQRVTPGGKPPKVVQTQRGGGKSDKKDK